MYGRGACTCMEGVHGGGGVSVYGTSACMGGECVYGSEVVGGGRGHSLPIYTPKHRITDIHVYVQLCMDAAQREEKRYGYFNHVPSADNFNRKFCSSALLCAHSARGETPSTQQLVSESVVQEEGRILKKLTLNYS